MLTRLYDSPSNVDTDEASPRPAMALSVAEIVAIAQRQWPLIASVLLVVLLLGVGYLFTAAARYSATASIMLDTRKNQLFQQQLVVGEMQFDPGAVDSQVEVLKSDSVALAVIRELKLNEDPEFNGSAGGQFLQSLVLGVFRVVGLISDAPRSDPQMERQAVEYFRQNLTIKRVATSYVIDVTFTSRDGQKSARIANTIADAYMVGELDSKYQATRRASRWLQDRMAELRTQASEADALVQKFKAENNIVDTGRGLMSDQQLTDVNTQLIAARATTAEAKARLDRIDQIAREDVPDASVTDALKSEVITRLRAQYLDLAGRESDWSTKYGNTHLATINLRNQMKEIKRSIQDELRRIAQSFKSDYEIARAREASVESSLSTLVGQSNLAGQAQIKLRDLESTSQSYRNLYDNFLQRFMEATQQQTFAINEARVISAATESLKKSWPKPIIILPACLVLGLMMGVGAAAGREYLDNNFRTVGQVEQACGVECVGVLPVISAPFEDGDDIYGDPERRILPMSLGLLRNVVDAPFARYAETLRSAKVAIDIRGLTQETRVIGIVSALPNEGKTLVASNIAQLAASSGQRAILIDADLRNPSLTKATAPGAEEGLIEILSGRRTEADVRWTDPVTGLHVIPAVVTGRISHTAELISSPAMAALLARLRKDYDYIFLDLPPIAPIVDVRAAARLIDGFLVVIEWGRTTKSIVAEAIGSDELIRSRAVGAVLNKANKSMLRRLESYKGRYYNNYYHDGGYPT